jgi:hypothetical protein
MSSNPTLQELRVDFKRSGGRFLSMPVAGAICWALAGISGSFLAVGWAATALLICCALITPLSLFIASFFHERLVGRANELGRLMGRSMLMTNLFWAIAVPFGLADYSSLPLSAGILMGLQWIVLGWIIQHWIGLVHALARTVLVLTAWCLFTEHRFLAVPATIVVMYVFSICVLASQPLPDSSGAPNLQQ